MATNLYSMASDEDLTLHLQQLFSEYISLYTKLYNEGGANADAKNKRIELVIKLESANSEMLQLVMEMQSRHAGTELIEHLATQTISSAKRSSRASLTDIEYVHC